MPEREQEWNGLVERIGRFLPGIRIRVPVCKRLFAAVERTGFISESVVMFIDRHRHPNPERVARKRHAASLVGQDLSRWIEEGQPQWTLLDAHDTFAEIELES